ncbi:hypothetical protein ROA7450_01411 [Roseovarius albus]|uniref:Uncharacterized protein n=1 Tax=Roseovarius albus TaxID=1247867 RepID=A0A1X6YUA1_9RHOB|nr:hypothetical protein [Roseovarius albus]SLN31619.1 hypothetical protein ROA7450_01411 [Roseovarius albus]
MTLFANFIKASAHADRGASLFEDHIEIEVSEVGLLEVDFMLDELAEAEELQASALLRVFQ